MNKGAKLIATTLSLILVLNFLAITSWAGPQWCEEDPEFLVNGAVVDVTTLFPGYYAYYVKGPVNFDIQVPSNVLAAAVSLPGTIPVTATISRTLPAYYVVLQIPVVVTVTMSSSLSFQTYTQITGLGGGVLTQVYGSSTYPTRARFKMYGL